MFVPLQQSAAPSMPGSPATTVVVGPRPAIAAANAFNSRSCAIRPAHVIVDLLELVGRALEDRVGSLRARWSDWSNTERLHGELNDHTPSEVEVDYAEQSRAHAARRIKDEEPAQYLDRISH